MIDLGVVTWSCLVALNMCLSMMIAVRIIMMRRTVINLLGRDHARVYTGAAAFVIEAAMPFMIISTVLLVLFGGKSTSSNLFVPCWSRLSVFLPSSLSFASSAIKPGRDLHCRITPASRMMLRRLFRFNRYNLLRSAVHPGHTFRNIPNPRTKIWRANCPCESERTSLWPIRPLFLILAPRY
ncbi:hypothetical protein BD779DRAFT_1698773 [Infundibulicybe gibba]|nr:hypothetical protein BD779DRAFT_1698773 [Infundibulicybe gibba]